MSIGYLIGCIFVFILFAISVAFFVYLCYDAFRDLKKIKEEKARCKMKNK